jgi:hypothetical protein
MATFQLSSQLPADIEGKPKERRFSEMRDYELIRHMSVFVAGLKSLVERLKMWMSGENGALLMKFKSKMKESIIC